MKDFVTRRFLSPHQCKGLITEAESMGFTRQNDTGPDGLTVKSGFVDLHKVEFGNLYEKCWDIVRSANMSQWQFDIHDWNQPLRVSKYATGDKHDWHLDYCSTDASKVAFSVPLNDFAGGDLELLLHGPVRPPVGHGVVFPAYHGHRVTRVTKGPRYVLLGWATGPRFR